MFHAPEFGKDLQMLPSIFLTRRLVWVPLVLLVIGLLIIFVLPSLPSTIASVADLYIQFFFVPPALFTFFIAGLLAPRASYLVGLVYGVLASLMWSFVILGPGGGLATTGSPLTTPDPLLVVANMLIIGVLYGTLAAGFAGLIRLVVVSLVMRPSEP